MATCPYRYAKRKNPTKDWEGRSKQTGRRTRGDGSLLRGWNRRGGRTPPYGRRSTILLSNLKDALKERYLCKSKKKDIGRRELTTAPNICQNQYKGDPTKWNGQSEGEPEEPEKAGDEICEKFGAFFSGRLEKGGGTRCRSRGYSSPLYGLKRCHKNTGDDERQHPHETWRLPQGTAAS